MLNKHRQVLHLQLLQQHLRGDSQLLINEYDDDDDELMMMTMKKYILTQRKQTCSNALVHVSK